MSKITTLDIYPFTVAELQQFYKELKQAGNFDKLMRQKEALAYSEGTWVIALRKDIEGYKDKYLTGIYEPLRDHYSTETPYIFWAKMNNAMQQAKKKL